MPPVRLKLALWVMVLSPRSTVIPPLPWAEATLKENAWGEPMCGCPSRLKRMRSIALASVAVPTVERTLAPMRSWSTRMAVVSPSSTSTSGRASDGMKPCTKVLYVSLISRCDSAAMVPKTSELLPEPEMPVKTVSRRLGISTLTSLRLFTRAPSTRMRSWPSAAVLTSDGEAREALGDRRRDLRADAHALGGLGALEVAGQVVQLGQAAALGVGHEQLDRLQRLAEGLLDAVAQLVEALAGHGRGQDALRLAEAEPAAALVVEHVGLVEDQQPRALAGADVLEDVVDGAQHRLELLLRDARVDDVQDQVGQARLLERRAEGIDQLVGQLLDEADGVGQQEAPPADLGRAGRRVEGVEEAVADADARAGERVEQRRLARVRVAGESHRRQVCAFALGTLDLARAAHVAELALERRDAVAGEAAVGLDLRLARASGADAAVHTAGAEALEVRPQAAHAREVVLELRELDQELALGRMGVV